MTNGFGTIIRAVAILGMAVWAAPAAADDFGATASTFIEELAGDVVQLTTSSDIPAAEREARIYGLFDERVDIPTIAKFTLGDYWRDASDVERREFAAVFRGLLVNTVSAHAGQFLSAPMEVERVVEVDNPKRAEALVLCRIRTAGGATFPLAWRVRDGESGPKVVDVIFNGISLIMTKRDEYTAVLRGNDGNVGALVARMKSLGAGDADLAAHQN